jgi:hypothetical protein
LVHNKKLPIEATTHNAIASTAERLPTDSAAMITKAATRMNQACIV